jgi:outer membrane protein TolC
MSRLLTRGRRLAAPLALLVLGGCASLSPDAGLGEVQSLTEAQLRRQAGTDVKLVRHAEPGDGAVQARVQELLAQPLTAESALQVALLNNAGLQASFEALGVADADRVQASRLPNPGFSFGRSRSGHEREIERGLGFDLSHILALPFNRKIEQRRVAALQRDVALQTLTLAADTRKAYYRAVAAEQTARYQRDVRESAEATAELARRMAAAGNFNKLQQAREQGFYAQATLQLARAEQQRVASREQLIRLMGLSGAQTVFTLPERLPDLPKAPLEQPDIEQLAMDQRLDLKAAREQVKLTASQLGLSRVTRVINGLDLDLGLSTDSDGGRERSWEVSFELPLFDWGDARHARAQSVYRQSLHRAAQAAVNARSEVRESYHGYRAAYDIAAHYRDELVPVSQLISQENLLRYNGMFIGVFELMADARAQIATVNAAIEALRDYWQAQADLDLALVGKPAPAALGGAAAAPAGGDAGGH